MRTWEYIGEDLGENWENDFLIKNAKKKTSRTWQEAVKWI